VASFEYLRISSSLDDQPGAVERIHGSKIICVVFSHGYSVIVLPASIDGPTILHFVQVDHSRGGRYFMGALKCCEMGGDVRWLRGRAVGVCVQMLHGQVRIAGLVHPRHDRRLVGTQVETKRIEIYSLRTYEPMGGALHVKFIAFLLRKMLGTEKLK
jgi:hypothetical protein